MSEASDTVTDVGDLLTLSIGLAVRSPSIQTAAERGPARMGLRRGTSATSWYDAGCRLEAVDRARAIAAYQRAIAGRPDFADAHNNLGRLLHHDAGAAAAESCYRLALCGAPGVALYWFNLG